MEEKYKLQILKDILKFSGKVLNEEEKDLIFSSALYQNKEYFTSAALLVKNNSISIDEFLSLSVLSREELYEFLEPTEESFDYFAEVTPADILSSLKEVEDFMVSNPEEYEKSKEIQKRRIAKIKDLHQRRNEELKHGA